MRRVLSSLCVGAILLWGTSAGAFEVKPTALPYAYSVGDGTITCRSASRVEFSCKGNLARGGTCPFTIGAKSYRAHLALAASAHPVTGGKSRYGYRFKGIACEVKVPSFVSGYRCSSSANSIACTVCVRVPFLGNVCLDARAALVPDKD